VRTEARFPALDRGAGHYESFYIKATRPEGGLGVWIRHTIHKRPHAEPTASIWFVLFDGEAGPPAAAKATFPAAELAAGNGAYVRVDGAALEPGRAVGEVRTEALDASWELEFPDSGEAFRHLPYGWMYRAPLPRTKFLSPYPNARFSGRVSVAGRDIELDRWPGMIGHNWGAEHAERWVWIQGGAFPGHSEDSYLDIAAGRIKLGPWTTPWVANGMLFIDGEAHRLGGLDRVRSTNLNERPTSCEFGLTGKATTVRGRVEAERRNFVGWVYADPDGPEHNTLNCSISDLRVTVEREGREPEHLRLDRTAAYEIGMRETDHGVPIQPYPDGEPADAPPVAGGSAAPASGP
jgi:hypothetical protein